MADTQEIKASMLSAKKSMTFKLAAVLCLLLQGCSMKLQYSGKNFESSQSLCVDALLVNIDAAGCEAIYYGHSPSYNAFKVRCISNNPKISNDDDNWAAREWVTNSFFISPAYNEMSSTSNLVHICADRNVRLYLLDDQSN